MNTHPIHYGVKIPARSPQRGLSRTIGIALFLSAMVMSGCAADSPVRHEYIMRGQVLSVDGNNIELCIGERDGAEVGQVLDVVRHTKRSQSSKASGPNFKREDIGRVRITGVFDEHYANATVLDGQLLVGDTVELER